MPLELMLQEKNKIFKDFMGQVLQFYKYVRCGIDRFCSHFVILSTAACLAALSYRQSSLSADVINLAQWYPALHISNMKTCTGFEPFFCVSGMIARQIGLRFDIFLFLSLYTTYIIICYSVYIACSGERELLQKKMGGESRLSFWLIYLVTLTMVSISYFKPDIVGHLLRQYLAGGMIVLAILLGNYSIKPRLFWALILIAPFIHFFAIFLSLAVASLTILQKRRSILIIGIFAYIILSIYLIENLYLLRILNEIRSWVNEIGLRLDSEFIKSLAYKYSLYINFDSKAIYPFSFRGIFIISICYLLFKKKIELLVPIIFIAPIWIYFEYHSPIISHRIYHYLRILVTPLLIVLSTSLFVRGELLATRWRMLFSK